MSPKIHPSFWSDPDVEKLTPNQRYAFLWILTNPQMTLCGYCEVSESRFHFETGLEKGVLWETIKALPRALKGFQDRNIVYVRNFLRHQLGDGDQLSKNNIFKTVLSIYLGIRHEQLRSQIESDYPVFKTFRKSAETPYQPLVEGKEQEQEKEKEQEKESEGDARGRDLLGEPVGSKRKPASLAEVQEFAKVIGAEPVEAEVFWDKGEGSGWKNDGKPIVCWRATMRNWHRMKILTPKPNENRYGHPKPNPRNEGIAGDADARRAARLAAISRNQTGAVAGEMDRNESHTSPGSNGHG